MEEATMGISENVLRYYVDLLRIRDLKQQKDKNTEYSVTALYNAIRTMKFSRHNKICGEDFSYLDFGSIPLSQIQCSDDGESPCVFDNCILHQESFLADDGHSPYYVVFCNGNEYFLSIDIRNYSIIVRNTHSMLSIARISIPYSFKYYIFTYDKSVVLVNDKKDLITIFDAKKIKFRKMSSHKDENSREYKEMLRLLKEHRRSNKVKEVCASSWVEIMNQSMHQSGMMRLDDTPDIFKKQLLDKFFIFNNKQRRIKVNKNGHYTIEIVGDRVYNFTLYSSRPYENIIDLCYSSDGEICAVVFNSTMQSNSHNYISIYKLLNNKYEMINETSNCELRCIDDCSISGDDIIAYSSNGGCLIKWRNGKICYSGYNVEYKRSLFNSPYSFDWFRNDIHFFNVKENNNWFISKNGNGIYYNVNGYTTDDYKIDISIVYAATISLANELLYLPFDPLNRAQNMVFKYSFQTKQCVSINLPFDDKPVNQPLPRVGQRGLNGIALSKDNSICAISSMEGCIYIFDKSLSTLYDTLYMLPDIYIKGCSFKKISAPEMIKKIIYQNNGELA